MRNTTGFRNEQELRVVSSVDGYLAGICSGGKMKQTCSSKKGCRHKGHPCRACGSAITMATPAPLPIPIPANPSTHGPINPTPTPLTRPPPATRKNTQYSVHPAQLNQYHQCMNAINAFPFPHLQAEDAGARIVVVIKDHVDRPA